MHDVTIAAMDGCDLTVQECYFTGNTKIKKIFVYASSLRFISCFADYDLTEGVTVPPYAITTPFTIYKKDCIKPHFTQKLLFQWKKMDAFPIFILSQIP